MTRFTTLCIAACLLTASARPADAQAIIHEGPLSGSLPAGPAHSQPIEGTASFAVPKFNPALGWLTAVTVEILDLSARPPKFDIDNENGQGLLFAVALNASFAVSAGLADTPFVARTGPFMGDFLVLADDDFGPDFTGNDSATTAAPGAVDGFGTLTKLVEQAALAGHSGAGDAAFGLKAGFAPAFGAAFGGGPIAPPLAYRFAGPVEFTGSYRVTYAFTAVPEPGPLALAALAAGAFGLQALARRKGP